MEVLARHMVAEEDMLLRGHHMVVVRMAVVGEVVGHILAVG